MRMRRKNNLDTRLEACRDIMTLTDLSEVDMRISAQNKQYYDFTEVFGNSNPIFLEIGCGQGGFIRQMAKLHPECNYIGCEKVSNVIITAAEEAKKDGLKNVYFFNCAAEVVVRYIRDGMISRMYLNFSDPLPKKGCARQRLTHPRFLELYYGLLVPGGEIFQKTDNELLYNYSRETYPACGFEIVSTSEDWDSAANGDIETEYERHFREMGKNIYRIVARKV